MSWPNRKRGPDKDMLGHKINRWTVIGRSNRRAADGTYYWKCRCVCGTEKDVAGGPLRKGSTYSCGCYVKETAGQRARLAVTTHGMSKTKTYQSWLTMRRRCYDKSYKDYPYYGGRGIQVFAKWKDSFENFLNDMGERPPRHTLDRIDTNKNYTPTNCRWAVHRTQMNNTRRNHFLTYEGKTLTLAELARKCNIPYTVLRARINLLKWPVAKALGFNQEG